MKILAMDTSANTASIAIVDEHKIIAETSVNHGLTHSQTIMPMLANILESVDMKLEEMDFIACSSGPGSFTGLRIGIATAKALAHGSGKKIIPVPTLDALAYNVFDENATIMPIMDARREQVYTASYAWNNGEFMRKTEYAAMDINELITSKQNIIFTGDATLVYGDIIRKNGHKIPPIHMQLQRGAAVGALALALAKKDVCCNYKDFTPFYLRVPQAEREYKDAKGDRDND